MPTSVFMPRWLSMGFLADLSAHEAQAPANNQDMPAFGDPSTNPETAWQRFQSLLRRKEPPTITVDGIVHRIVDFERYDEGLLSYARVTRDGQDTGEWRLFLQDALNDPHPLPLASENIRESLLNVYLDEALQARREEITQPEISEMDSLPVENGKITKKFSLQNSHRLAVLACPPMEPRLVQRRSGEQIKIGQFPIEGLLVYLKMLPLAALTQVDEFRLSQRYHPGKSGSATSARGHFLVRLYPFERIMKKSRQDASEPESKDMPILRFFYSLCHEAFGHPMIYRNRYLRRELMKIVASGEPPPSPYAKAGIEEWFAEGTAEFWRRYSLEGDDVTNEWRFKHPYLSGLVLHLLGVLEEVAEPANKNIEHWAKSMRPIRKAG